MKAYALYRPASEFARIVEEYAHDFERSRGKEITLVSLDTREGADMARLYGIIRYPAIVATREDGELLQVWEGEILPLMDEVAAQIRQ